MFNLVLMLNYIRTLYVLYVLGLSMDLSFESFRDIVSNHNNEAENYRELASIELGLSITSMFLNSLSYCVERDLEDRLNEMRRKFFALNSFSFIASAALLANHTVLNHPLANNENMQNIADTSTVAVFVVSTLLMVRETLNYHCPSWLQNFTSYLQQQEPANPQRRGQIQYDINTSIREVPPNEDVEAQQEPDERVSLLSSTSNRREYAAFFQPEQISSTSSSSTSQQIGQAAVRHEAFTESQTEETEERCKSTAINIGKNNI